MTYLLDFYNQIYSYLSGPELSGLISALKLISWSISGFLIFLIIILLRRSDAAWRLRERFVAQESVYGPQRVDRRWQKIGERLQRGDEANLKLAVIEADNLFDDILKRMALPGRDMGERLAQFEKHELSSIDLVWDAHRLRNLIVHNHEVKITRDQAEQAVSYIEKALKELEYL